MISTASSSISRRTAGGGHRVPDDVLVERFAGADAEEEATLEEQRRGGRRLGDDCGMHADDRARHADADLDALGRRGDRAEHAPDERAVALRAHPWVVVIGDRRELEADLLRGRALRDERGRRVLLARQRVAEGRSPLLRSFSPWPCRPFGRPPSSARSCRPAWRAALARLLAAALRRVGRVGDLRGPLLRHALLLERLVLLLVLHVGSLVRHEHACTRALRRRETARLTLAMRRVLARSVRRITIAVLVLIVGRRADRRAATR